jgi:hypothetical protein
MDNSSVELVEQNTALTPAAETIVSNSLKMSVEFMSVERRTGRVDTAFCIAVCQHQGASLRSAL